MTARLTFLVCALAALPGALWQALEMYGLTLGGAQMLFFSIIHTMPFMVILVLLAVPFILALFLQSAAALSIERYRSKIGITRPALAALSLFLLFHSVALLTYDAWSNVSYLRVPICLAGIALFALAITLVVTALAIPRARVSDA